MKLTENHQVTQSDPSELIKVKSAQSFRGVFRTQLKILAFILGIEKKLQRKCLTRSSIPTPLKLTIKTSEQQLLYCSCAFIVDFEQILFIGFHAYLTLFHKLMSSLF